LAIALMKLRDFRDTDFAQFHPGGSLGRRLLTTVEDVMHRENLPICSKNSGIKEIIQSVSEGKMGLSIIIENSNILGIITDGDIRRAMESKEEQFFTLKAIDLMTQNPKSINPKAKLMEAQTMMAKYKVNSLLVVENNILIGIVQIYDLGI